MAISYSKDSTSVNNLAGTKFTTGRADVYTITRGFLRFDLSSYGWALADISAVELRTYHTTLSGGSSGYRLRSAVTADTNWGTTLFAGSGDFNSTSANIETTDTLSSTGWHAWTVDKNNLDLSGVNWYRLAITAENQKLTRQTLFSSDNAASNHAVLRVTTVDGVVNIPMRTVLGVGT